jgi:HlyD family secretion protein
LGFFRLESVEETSKMNQISPPSRAEIEQALDLTPNRMRSRWLRRLVWLAVFGGVSMAGYAAYQNYAAVKAVVTYDTSPATISDLIITVSATGTIQPITQVDIGSEMSGVVREVRVDDNSIVKSGEVLALLDTARLDAQKARSEAQVASAEARLAEARSVVEERKTLAERRQQLRRKGLSTEQDAENAQSALAQGLASVRAAEAAVASAKADLVIVETELRSATIASPIDGVVLKRGVEPGQTVAASFQAPVLFTIAQDLKRVQLEAAVDEADMGAVKNGQRASFSVDAYRGREFPAVIERLSYAPETVDGVVTYKAILSAPNEDLALRPGMTATAKIVVEEYGNALTVANEALRYQPPRPEASEGFSITRLFLPRFPRSGRGQRESNADGLRDIHVLRAGVPVKVAVKTGATDGKRTHIRDGEVKDGDLVVTAQRSQSQ